MHTPRILVVGSVNMDLVARVDGAPGPGENVRAASFETVPGGKGANQAVACARLGAETRMLARVGDDAFGDPLRRSLAKAGVRTDAVATVEECSSGIALILVEASGENRIVVVPGANARLTPEDVEAARPLIEQADAVLLQLEIPSETVAQTVRLAREARKTVVVDAGPPRRPVDEAVFRSTVLTPNEAEAAALLGLEPGTAAPEALAEALLARGPHAVVLKIGARGAVVAEAGHARRVPGFRVRAVDTTAAGDAFTAALAVEIVRGTDLTAAARTANAAGALACTRPGAQPSMPTADEVADFLERHA